MKRYFWQISFFVLLTGVLISSFQVGEIRAQSFFDRNESIFDNWRDRFDVNNPKPSVSPECVVTGCSSELCMPKGTDIDVSPCVWKEEYACYRQAQCEKQSNGQCGWTQNQELLQCIDQSRNPQPSNTPTPLVFTPTPTRIAGPVCGNNICETGEGSHWDCPACNPLFGFCSRRACVLQLGACTSDCPDAGLQPTITPTPTKKPNQFPFPSSDFEFVGIDPTPTPIHSDINNGDSWMEQLWGQLSGWWSGIQ